MYVCIVMCSLVILTVRQHLVLVVKFTPVCSCVYSHFACVFHDYYLYLKQKYPGCKKGLLNVLRPDL